MNKEFIPYEEALALKELGFDEPCLAFYDGKGTEQVYFNSYRNGSGDYEPFKKSERLTWFGAPLYQQAFRWFREKTFNQLVINERGDTIQGMLTLLPLVYLNSYEIHVIKESDSHFINHVSGKSIPFYGAARHKYHAYSPSYDEAQLDCLRKLIEITKNK